MTELPSLRTARLILRPAALCDLDAYHRLWQTPVELGFVGRPRSDSLEATAARLRRTLDLQASGELMSWALTEAPEAPMVGVVGLCRFERAHRRAEVAYELLPSHQGSGLMAEALAAVVDHAFSALELHRLMGAVDPRNTPSIRVLERCKFAHEGTLRHNLCIDDRYFDSAIYARLSGQ